MEVEKDKLSVTVIYRGKKYTVEMLADATLGSLGTQLSELTGVVPRTMRLLLPKGKSSVVRIAINPSSELYSSTTLEQFDITPGVVIRMMGATSEELEQVNRSDKDERVLGFEEEENRRKLRRLPPLTQLDAKARLPKGPYTFQEFRTLELPLIQLNPSPESARAIMYRLASDPGIVAIMKKHKWQVGIMSELAPEGYVGKSPKCILGFNRNRGQEISLRLRTDDFEGFRKYASIKMTLIHELTHMIHDEHDEDFHALNKQLTKEAIELDWTNGTGHTLSGEAFRGEEDADEPMDAGGVQTGHKVGGGLPSTANARVAAAQAALARLEQTKIAVDSGKVDPLETAKALEALSIRLPSSPSTVKNINEPDADDKAAAAAAAAADEIVVVAEGMEFSDNQDERMEPDPDESTSGVTGHDFDAQAKPGLEDTGIARGTPLAKSTNVAAEPDPDESTNREEPDPEESKNREEPDPDESTNHEEPGPEECTNREEPGLDNSIKHEEQPDLGVSVDSEGPAHPLDLAREDEEIVRIQAATNAVKTRLQHAVSALKSQATPVEATTALNTLSTIVSNLINNPNEDRYKYLRKGNARFQYQVGRFEGAVEFLQLVGFREGQCDNTSCFVWKRSDLGLLWLARSILQPH